MATGSKRESGIGGERLAQVSGNVFSELVERIKNQNHQRKTKPDLRAITDHWSFPDGKDQPALILVINEYVDDPATSVYIPSEISLCSFTLLKGLSPHFYWTLVDPGRRIPMGHGIEASRKAVTYGIPQPGYGEGEKFQDYQEIVHNLEALISKAGGQPISGLGYVLWCLEENVSGYTLGLQWLYHQAGKVFQHKIMALESLLVTLSLGGLQSLAVRRHGKTGMTFPQVLDTYENAVHSASARNDPRSVATTLDTFMRNVSGTSAYTYSIMGGSTTRHASRQFKFPEAMLGAFIFDGQATSYLKHVGYLYVDRLACGYHQDKTDSLPSEMAVVLKGLQKDARPSNQLVKCALLKARSLIFLMMDVLLVNYGIEAKKGFHYLPEEL